MFAKTNVIGEDAHPVWRHLAAKSGTEPNWNFFMYLVDHRGKVAKVFPTGSEVKSVVKACDEAVAEAKKAKGQARTMKKEL